MIIFNIESNDLQKLASLNYFYRSIYIIS